MQPYELTASDAARLIAERKLSCEELARSCLARIERRDATVRAWAYVDPAQAIRQARELDKATARGPLHGVPIGLKDVIDTADMPTSHNSPLYLGHQPSRDANCVTTMKCSGGLILGKTETVELASRGRKALTTNPHNAAHTPGGSSSGSGAAVADLHVPLAVGTQTAGSVIRPAAFNGIYAIKPTFGLVSMEGVKDGSPSLDTLGWYGRAVSDLALLGRAFQLPGLDQAPPARLQNLRIGVCKTPMWPHAGPGTHLAMKRASERLAAAGCQMSEFDLPAPFDRLADTMMIVLRGEVRVTFLSEYLKFGDKLHENLRNWARNEDGITAEQLRAALDLAAAARVQFEQMLASMKLDCIVAPSAPDEAPEGLHTTGEAIFNGMWTLLHMPCIAIPTGLGPRKLPVGIEVIGPRFADGRLLRVAEAIAPVLDLGDTRVAA